MSVAYITVAIVVGAATIGMLWLHSPVLALVCAPLAASTATALAAVVTALPRRERGKTVASAVGLKAQ